MSSRYNNSNSSVARSSIARICQLQEYETRCGRQGIHGIEGIEDDLTHTVREAQNNSALSSKQIGDYQPVEEVLDIYYEGLNTDLPDERLDTNSSNISRQGTDPRSSEQTEGHQEIAIPHASYCGFLEVGYLDQPLAPNLSEEDSHQDIRDLTAADTPIQERNFLMNTRPSRDSTHSYVMNDYGTISTNIRSTPRITNNSFAVSSVDPNLVHISHRNSKLFPSMFTGAEAEIYFGQNRASVITMSTVFNDGTRSMYQLHRSRFTPVAQWAKEHLQEPPQQLSRHITSLPRVVAMRKKIVGTQKSLKESLRNLQ